MSPRKLILILPVLFASLFNSQKIQNLAKYVNPIIGTEKMGHTYPGATVPFGVVPSCPATDIIFRQVLINIKSEVQA
ncbi:hypothetical protein [Epilithonimonas hominis]|uniref:hypothetical protein n=1 Tax=Epilithonimonas hominis TaxID=420404 RepID=UPI000ED00788|nr:hypothetical protein [Epilithonimonas hominis]HAP94459.1 hypothetical protein [Chryseobacterium sp.]